MTESLFTMALVGFLAGFILSMPIAGPVSIYITSNALKGLRRYCNLVAIGASLGDFVYVFIAVFGLTKLYSYYKPFIPYLLIAGAIFLFYVGYKVFKTKVDIEHLDDKKHIYEKIKNKERGGFYTGLMLNVLNPELLLGWLTSSFFVITFVSSLGFNTGGLDTRINHNAKNFSHIKGDTIEKTQIPTYLQFNSNKPEETKSRKEEFKSYPKYFHLFISFCYAFFVALGGIIWFYLLTFALVRFRKNISDKYVNLIINGLGMTLCIIALFFVYTAIKMFL